MRIYRNLYAPPNQHSARSPQKEPVPLKILMPMELSKTVSSKGDKLKEAACLQDLAVMFACFKKFEFDQQKCLKEITAFQGCYDAYNKKMKAEREQAKKGILVPGEKKLTHRQLNKLLKNFPPLK